MKFLNQRSMSNRLLTYVNLITFFVVTGLSGLIVYRLKASAEHSLQSKIQASLNFLKEISPQYVTNYDLSALEKFARIVSEDPDMAYVVFYDPDGKPMTDAKKIVEGKNIVRLEQSLVDSENKNVGKLTLGYRTDSITNGYHNALITATLAIAVVEILLTFGIWALIRNVLAPVVPSLKKLSRMTSVLKNTSEDITKSSESLSSGVNQQAAVVQQTTSAMSEMSGMLTKTTDYAKQSEQVMDSMTQKAKHGMSIMNDMVDAMSSVQQANAQLKQMAKIISEITSKTNVINDIVFKTQLLSFNASIEAARAGQHGRGFSVVAEEVGNLAKMSGTAAQEIAALLQDSERQVNEIVQTTSERVNAGKAVAEQAMKNFKEMANEISQTSTQISNISSATREQEFGITQTTQAMTELNKTAEANAQIAQRSNSAASTLRRETHALITITRSIHDALLGSDSANFQVELRERQPQQASPNNSVATTPDRGSTYPEMAHSLTDKVVDLARKKQWVGETESEEQGADPLLNETTDKTA